jgi:hypothetical protein
VTNPDPDPADREPASPYGPHPHGVDEAAGGADSSPHESEPTGEREEREERKEQADEEE